MSEKGPGLEEYKPTRLDWLTVMLNSLFKRPNVQSVGFDMFYLPGSDGYSITLVVSHSADANKRELEEAINVAKNFARVLAKNYGWDEWIKVTPFFSVIDNEKKE